MMLQEKPIVDDVFASWQGRDPERQNLQVEYLLNEVFSVLQERGKVYDTPGESGCKRIMEKVVALFNLRTGLNLTEAHGWIFMGYLKDVRQDAAGGKHYDSAVDKVCYALLEAEARFQDRVNTE